MLFKASVTASDVCALILNHKDILVCLSTIVRTEGSLSSFVPTTVSISQCPNSLRFSISFGRSSMLLPNTRLFFRTIVDFFFLPVFCGYSSAKVIFSNNGADQYPAQNQEGLTVSGEKWYKSGSFYDQNPDLSKVSVHYYNSNQWGSPYIYYYTDSETPVTWPGTAMTSDGNGWYSYDIYGFDEVKVIFSDNGANQIPQQNETGYTVTGEKWFINGTLYDAEPDGITVHFYDYK